MGLLFLGQLSEGKMLDGRMIRFLKIILPSIILPKTGIRRSGSQSRDRSNDGTPVGFAQRRRSWGGCEFPGERSLSLGTPGLQDESPLGLG
jgi:hypothetical protein